MACAADQSEEATDAAMDAIFMTRLNYRGQVCVLVEKDEETGYLKVRRRFNFSESQAGDIGDVLYNVLPFRKSGGLFKKYHKDTSADPSCKSLTPNPNNENIEAWVGADYNSPEDWQKSGWRWYIGYRVRIGRLHESYGYLAYYSPCTYETEQQCLQSALQVRMQKCEHCENGKQCLEDWKHDVVILEHVDL